MIKNILIISSDFTGHGHKSITESLLEQFSAHYPNVNVHVIDGFTLGGSASLRIGKMYGSLTRNAKELWKLVWEVQFKNPSVINEFTESAVRESFLKLIKRLRPDLILSVHPSFNGSIINIMEEYKIKIPFVTLIADLVSITPLWADPRVNYIICPTKESAQKSLEFGVDESKLEVIGFPVRARFTKHIGTSADNKDYSTDKPLNCLIMSGGEGVGNMSRIAEILLDNFNCHIRIIAGRNAILKRRLERTLIEKYGEKVEIFGFTENVQDLMLASDIAFTRGSPNVMMEAVSCNVPLVVTGALPGQEEGNPGYLLKYNLGVVCKDIRKLKNLVKDLLDNDAKKLNQIKKAQREYRDPEIPKKIVDFLMSVNTDGVSIPKFTIRPSVISKEFINRTGRATKTLTLRNIRRLKRKIK